MVTDFCLMCLSQLQLIKKKKCKIKKKLFSHPVVRASNYPVYSNQQNINVLNQFV